MFISGYSTDVLIQREYTPMGRACEQILTNPSLTMFSIQAMSGNRLSRTSANWRVDTYKTLQGFVQLKLSFELRLSSPILELIRTLLSLYDFAQQTQPFPIEARTWQPDLVDDVHTCKIWIKDRRTGKVTLHEGCAVATMELTAQSRTVTVIAFGLVALKTTHLDSLPDPGNLYVDKIPRPISAPEFCGAYYTDTDFADDTFQQNLIPGVTRSDLVISRDLNATSYRSGKPLGFTHSPPAFTAAIDCRITPTLATWLDQFERYGAAILRFGDSAKWWLEALIPQVALTFGEAQLHSTTDTPSLTITMVSIDDMTATGGAALRLYRTPEVWDGGEIGETDTYQAEGIDGGNCADNLLQPQPHVDGGTL
jgi:hypothetical protein